VEGRDIVNIGIQLSGAIPSLSGGPERAAESVAKRRSGVERVPCRGDWGDHSRSLSELSSPPRGSLSVPNPRRRAKSSTDQRSGPILAAGPFSDSSGASGPI